MQIKKFKAVNIQEFITESELILEGASDILYHFTTLERLISIIDDNEFSLTSVLTSDIDQVINGDKFFYLSTTRSKSTGFVKGNVRIKLDGRKLKFNNKIAPVDFWQKSKDPTYYQSHAMYISAMQSGEQEDRIISDRPFIPDAINFISEVHIFSPSETNIFFRALDLCEEKNIKLKLFRRFRDWKLEINQVEPETFDRKEVYNLTPYKSYMEFPYVLAALIAYKSEGNHQKIVDFLGDEKEVKKFEDACAFNKKMYFGKNAQAFDYVLDRISNIVSEIRSVPSPEHRFLFGLMTQDFRRLKVTSLADYIKKKRLIEDVVDVD